jgi:hypothetical protein
MPWLGDGTWVQDASLARDIIHGKTNYVPWSHNLSTATKKTLRKIQGGLAAKEALKRLQVQNQYAAHSGVPFLEDQWIESVCKEYKLNLEERQWMLEEFRRKPYYCA